MNPKVTLIVPIYKVEAFIERCTTTLMEQTLREVEYIFVDDATPDHSIQILEEVVARYPERKEQVRIVHHEENKGLPAARNTGLTLATGEYIFHCDSDDFVEPTMLEELSNAAKEKNADIVWCDWYLTFEQNERYMRQPSYATAMEALQGVLHGNMKYNVWNKLVRRSLYTDNQILFPAGYGMGEDMTMIRLMACARQVAYVPKAFYHYIKTNSAAFTNSYSERHLNELLHNTQETIEFIEAKFGKETMEKDLAAFKLSVKFPFLITDDRAMYAIWDRWFRDANRYIFADSSVPLRNKLLQYAAAQRWWWLVALYYKLVYKVIYGIIYK